MTRKMQKTHLQVTQSSIFGLKWSLLQDEADWKQFVLQSFGIAKEVQALRADWQWDLSLSSHSWAFHFVESNTDSVEILGHSLIFGENSGFDTHARF